MAEKDLVKVVAEVECHIGRDIRDTLGELANRLPPSPLLAVVTGAMQEIDALRAMIAAAHKDT